MSASAFCFAWGISGILICRLLGTYFDKSHSLTNETNNIKYYNAFVLDLCTNVLALYLLFWWHAILKKPLDFPGLDGQGYTPLRPCPQLVWSWASLEKINFVSMPEPTSLLVVQKPGTRQCGNKSLKQEGLHSILNCRCCWGSSFQNPMQISVSFVSASPPVWKMQKQ